MALSNLKKTKILATVGPASSDPKVLERLIKAGANGLRLNLSHGTHAEHAAVIRSARKISKQLKKPIAIVADLQGPKIRLGFLPDEGLTLTRGQAVSFRPGDFSPDGKAIAVQHDIARYIKPGERLFLRDGLIEVMVKKVNKGVIDGSVINPGIIFSHQGINLPETDLGGNILTPKDIADIEFAHKHDVDFLALSFVQSARDIVNLSRRLEKLGSAMAIIAKIETKAATKELEEIVAVADGVMVARGDLAIETLPEQVPMLQQKIIELTRRHQKIAIVATQMLESMIHSTQPTRAEVSDVATAVTQGFDAVMLSGESAIGKHPVHTVALMKRIIIYTERNRPTHIEAADFAEHAGRVPIATAAITLAEQTKSKLILAETTTGQTARNLSSFRSAVPIVVVTHHPRTYQQTALLWGSRSYLIKNPLTATEEIKRALKSHHDIEPGDVIIRASGSHTDIAGGTDTLQIQIV